MITTHDSPGRYSRSPVMPRSIARSCGSCTLLLLALALILGCDGLTTSKSTQPDPERIRGEWIDPYGTTFTFDADELLIVPHDAAQPMATDYALAAPNKIDLPA